MRVRAHGRPDVASVSDMLNGCLVDFLLEFTAGRGGVSEDAGNDVDDW